MEKNCSSLINQIKMETNIAFISTLLNLLIHQVPEGKTDKVIKCLAFPKRNLTAKATIASFLGQLFCLQLQKLRFNVRNKYHEKKFRNIFSCSHIDDSKHKL